MAIEPFLYTPDDSECEKASNSYLMSMMAMAVGMTLPIVNLIATLIFYLGNRNGTYFVRWHCTQALTSQLSVFPINSVAVWWSLSIALTSREISNAYIAYVFTALLFNAFELMMTVRSAIQTRKGHHVYWKLFGPLTDLLVRP